MAAAGQDHAGHDHGHAHGPSAFEARGSRRYQRRLLFSFVLIALYFVVELVAGLWTNSLALLSDAGHMLTDVLGLGMAVAAIAAANRGGRDPQKTFGLYRLEILAALANAFLLFGVALYILFEAVQRFSEPPAVDGGPMLVVAAFGLLVNVIVFLALRSGARESLNVEGAYLEVLADALGSVGVIVAAVILQTTGLRIVDPIFGVAIGLFVLPRTLRLARRALRILIQAAPPEADVGAMRASLASVPGVRDVHDLHVWTLTSGVEVATVHLGLTDTGEWEPVRREARRVLREQFGVQHLTIEPEPEGDRCAPGSPDDPCA